MTGRKDDAGALKIDFYVTPEKYEEIAKKQKTRARAIADLSLIHISEPTRPY